VALPRRGFLPHGRMAPPQARRPRVAGARTPARAPTAPL
jgi:hypothetical protein